MMIEIALEADEEWDSSGSWTDLAQRAVEAAVAESAFPGLASGERAVEISLRLTGDDEVRELNASWRGKDKATNVLSFPMARREELNTTKVAVPELLLGDIILAHGVCQAEAQAKAVSVEQHAAHLIVHGTLHLLGYDHEEDNEAAEMEVREVRALKRLGIADPYKVTA